MSTTQTPIARPGSFGAKLHILLKERNMGARTLAKVISRTYGGTVENRRRAILRWLQGSTPNTYNRHLVEDILGVPRDSLRGDDEDEESDPVAFLVYQLHQAIDVLTAAQGDHEVEQRWGLGQRSRV